MGSFESAGGAHGHAGASQSAVQTAVTWVAKSVIKAATGTTPAPDSMPQAFTRVAFYDDMTLRQMRTQGAAIPAPSGPIQALRPDAETRPVAMSLTLPVHAFDPVAPYAGGEHYEPRTPRGRMNGPAVANPGLYREALYPDGSGDDSGGGGSEVAIIQRFVVGDRPRAPGEGGDPHALIGSLGGGTIVSTGDVADASKTPTT